MSDYVEAGRSPFGGRARDGAPLIGGALAAESPVPLERAAYYLLLAFAAALQISIFASEVLLTLTGLCWLALVLRRHERIEVPKPFWPLAAYAGATIVASVFSIDPRTSLIDCKQLLLFLIVPIAYRLMRGSRTLTVVDVIISVGALTAVLGVFQFGILKWDQLGQRPRGALGMYMTYSGQLMLVACIATSRILFRKGNRLWPSLVMPALVVALAATLSRNAWVGACTGIGLLLLIRDFRLVALLPVVAAVFIGFAPAQLTERLYSTFRINEGQRVGTTTTEASLQSNRDRIFMIGSGLRIVRDNPLTGVGPDMVRVVYPAYRHPEAVNQLNPHLHNVPLQIAAERGLPALALWVWFVVMLIRDFVARWRRAADPWVPAAALASVVALLAAGMFEYNFGDSEVLMLFLLIVTLPYAAERSDPHRVS